MTSSPYAVRVIMHAYFEEHGDVAATSAQVTAWAVKRWPLFTNLMAAQWFYRMCRIGRAMRVPAERRERYIPNAYRLTNTAKGTAKMNTNELSNSRGGT